MRGTEGYVENAAILTDRWRRLSFADKPEPVRTPFCPSCLRQFWISARESASMLRLWLQWDTGSLQPSRQMVYAKRE